MAGFAAALRDGEIARLDQAVWAAIDAWIAGDAEARPAVSEAVAGRPCAVAPATWHAGRLRDAMAASDPVRTAYHGRWLGFFLSGEDPAWLPMVSVVIPVYNRASIVVDAIESCLAQSYQKIEIIVVDDGSTDGLAGALRPWDGRFSVLRQANKGVSAARNAGVAAASGDYIQFLDSDDLLHPDAIALKIEAFRAVADTDICTSRVAAIDRHGVDTWYMGPPYLDRGADSPVEDLLHSACRRTPFRMSTLMVARWRVVEVGPFEEDMKRGEDRRFFFRLGMTGAKVVARRERLTLKRVFEDSLERSRQKGETEAGNIHFRTAAELVEQPDNWSYLPYYLGRLEIPGSWQALADGENAPVTAGSARRLIVAVESIDEAARRAGLSALPVLTLIKLLCAAVQARLPTPSPYWAALFAAAQMRTEAAAPLNAGDIDYWRAAGRLSAPDHPLVRACERIAAGGDAASLDAFLRSPGFPLTRQTWSAYERRVGANGPARAVRAAKRVHATEPLFRTTARARSTLRSAYARLKVRFAARKARRRRAARSADAERYLDGEPFVGWARTYWARFDAD